MVRPEWSPNESYLTKLERLAFALVRTRPPKEATCDTGRRSRNLWSDKCKGLAGPFALALLVAIPYIAENSSGPIIVAALLLAAVDASLTVWCYTDFESQHGHCPGDLYNCMFTCVGEFPAFLIEWWWISAMSTGFAACARTLSSIMDSVTGRHVETLMENTVGSFTPFGAPLDIMSVGVVTVPTIMCTLGMEDSSFLRCALFALTSTTTLSIFGYALATNHLFPSGDSVPSIIPDGSLYAKIFSGATLASVGFLGLYTVSRPDNVTLTQHKHFHVSKRFSLTGCVVASSAFLLYFIESTVINKVQQTPSLWDGDPPLLWPMQGGWRLLAASLGIAALALTTFEFLVPLCISVTKLANDGLLYRKLRKPIQDEPMQWNPITPLVFGGITALQSMLIDTKVLLGLVASSFMSINILVCSCMIALRYQVNTPAATAMKRSGHGHTQTRPRPNRAHPHLGGNGEGGGSSSSSQHSSSSSRHHHQTTRRLLTVSFLKSGLGKMPRDVVHEIDVCHQSSSSADLDGTSDRAYLMGDVGITSVEPSIRRESASEFSMGSNVSGYESESEHEPSEDGTDDTDIDAVVTEYQEHVRVMSLNGGMPMFPTPATARRVALSVTALVPCCLAMATAVNRSPRAQFTGIMLGISSGLLTFLLLVVISRQPQRRLRDPCSSSSSSSGKRGGVQSSSSGGPNNTNNSSSSSVSISPSGEHPSWDGSGSGGSNASSCLQHSIIPWLPTVAVFIHCCLLLQALDFAATPFALWLSIGLIIYFSYSVTKSVAAPCFIIPNERIRLNGTPRQSLMSSTVVCGNDPSTATTSTSTSSEPYAQIDSVLLA